MSINNLLLLIWFTSAIFMKLNIGIATAISIGNLHLNILSYLNAFKNIKVEFIFTLFYFSNLGNENGDNLSSALNFFLNENLRQNAKESMNNSVEDRYEKSRKTFKLNFSSIF